MGKVKIEHFDDWVKAYIDGKLVHDASSISPSDLGDILTKAGVEDDK